MRQAGRALPEYRKLREGTAMLESCFRPDMVTEITLQPVRRYGVDAAILFSDIVVPLKAIGVDLDIVPGTGPVVADPIRSTPQLAQLRDIEPDDVAPIAESVRAVVGELGATPLIGFAGAPFTLASYLVEGGPSKDLRRTKQLMYGEPELCSIENLDPMGVHTGDSITVAPAMTLTDREYQQLRDISIGIIREVGVETGGCNIQFAVNPEDGRIVVIEMNPRVSRSSALASKATGFPIAKIAAKVAIGYTLDEITNDITAETPASFEPTLDYVVVKVPRFAFEKWKSVV